MFHVLQMRFPYQLVVTRPVNLSRRHLVVPPADSFKKLRKKFQRFRDQNLDLELPPIKVERWNKKKITVEGLLNLKGKGKLARQLTLATVFDEWTARAAEQAGVDMILAWGSNPQNSKFVIEAVCRGAPNTLIGSGVILPAQASVEDALKVAGEIRSAGRVGWPTDIIYCPGLVPSDFTSLTQQGYSCCGHVGYLPKNDTWYGGPRAIGKTWEEAKKVYDDVMALEAAGCVAVVMEVVPAKVAAEITKCTKMLVFSIGSGPHCDGQFIFSEDILGASEGHYPRHSISFAHLMEDAVDAFSEYREDIVSGAYRPGFHGIGIKDKEFTKFMEAISHHTPHEDPPADHAIKVDDKECVQSMEAISDQTPSLPVSSPLHEMRNKKLTIEDLIALKGKRKIVVTTAFDEWTARAAEEAGVDMVVAYGSNLENTKFVIEAVRRGAPNTLIGSGSPLFAYAKSPLKIAKDLRAAGADILYCSGVVPQKFAVLLRHSPCCGHVGFLELDDTWSGGSDAFGQEVFAPPPGQAGKTWEEAKQVYDDVMALEAAGCIAVEMECVPAKVAAEITKRTTMLVFSSGSGPNCDGQFMVSEDLLGTKRGPYPRHSVTYSFLMEDAVETISQYRKDIITGIYPTAEHNIEITDEEFARFMDAIT